MMCKRSTFEATGFPAAERICKQYKDNTENNQLDVAAEAETGVSGALLSTTMLVYSNMFIKIQYFLFMSLISLLSAFLMELFFLHAEYYKRELD